ncbi:phage tail fiber protein [Lichenicoccus sp.]|uniref:phage tail fiber protein n=1 Tax=Lichenicoccus sp. TaxID=2781899 RepID=UPI003D102A27
MPSFFSGWIGYGLTIQGGALLEPVDPGYARRQIHFSPLQNGTCFDTSGGTSGPSVASWGTLACAALFDAVTAGNLLLWWPLSSPAVIAAGRTYTTSMGTNILFFHSLREGPDVFGFPGGSTVAVTPDGRPVGTGVALQVVGGVLSANPATFGSTVVMPALPAAASTPGSGQLWNDGGVVAVS